MQQLAIEIMDSQFELTPGNQPIFFNDYFEAFRPERYLIKSSLGSHFDINLVSLWIQHQRLLWLILIPNYKMMYKAAINTRSQKLGSLIKKDNVVDQSTLQAKLANVVQKFIKYMKFKVSWNNHVKVVLFRICHTADGMRAGVIKEGLDLHLISVIGCPNVNVLFSKRYNAIDILILKNTQYFVRHRMSSIAAIIFVPKVQRPRHLSVTRVLAIPKPLGNALNLGLKASKFLYSLQFLCLIRILHSSLFAHQGVTTMLSFFLCWLLHIYCLFMNYNLLIFYYY